MPRSARSRRRSETGTPTERDTMNEFDDWLRARQVDPTTVPGEVKTLLQGVWRAETRTEPNTGNTGGKEPPKERRDPEPNRERPTSQGAEETAEKIIGNRDSNIERENRTI